MCRPEKIANLGETGKLCRRACDKEVAGQQHLDTADRHARNVVIIGIQAVTTRSAIDRARGATTADAVVYDEPIITNAAIKRVGAGIVGQFIIAVAAIKHVIACVAVDGVVAVVTVQKIISIPAVEQVIAKTADQRIIV